MKRFYYTLFLLANLFFSCGAFAQPGWLWGRTAAGVGDAWTMTADHPGNVYAGGSLTFGSATFDSITVPGSSTANQAVWAKFNSAGTPLWADGAIGSSWMYQMTTDPLGNLIIVGSFNSDSIQIGAYILVKSGAGHQYFVAKISPVGTVLWAHKDGHPWFPGGSDLFVLGINTSECVTTDNAGNVYIAGAFKDATMTIGPYTLNNSNVSGTTTDVFVAKYTPAGALVWASSAGGSGNDYPFGITVATSGNVYVTGAFRSPSIAFGSSIISNPYSNPLAFLIKFSSAGVPLLAQAAGGTHGAYGVGLQHDSYGNIYLMGNYGDTGVTIGSATFYRTYPATVPQLAIFLVKLSASDMAIWGRTISGPGVGSRGFSLAMGGVCGQVWVSGVASTGAVLGPGDTMTIVAGSDPTFMAGYNLAGNVKGYTSVGADGDDQNGIALDDAGNVYICSDFEPTTLYPDFRIGPDTLTGGSSPEEHFYVAKYSPHRDTVSVRHDTIYCSAGITFTAPSGYGTYFWSDSIFSQSRTVSGSGTYWVYCTACSDTTLIDTFHVTQLPDSTFEHQDTFSCKSGDLITSITLTAPSGTNYLWFNGDTTSGITINYPGNYWVIYRNGCAVTFDTFHVVQYEVPSPINGPVFICIGDMQQYADSVTGGWWQCSAPAVTSIDSITGMATGISAGAATITYTAATGCFTTKSVTVLAPPCITGLNGVANIVPVELYPNPALDELTIKSDRGVYNSCSITNTIGQQLIQQTINSWPAIININTLPAGLYYITLKGDNGAKVVKFVKLQ